MQANQAAPSGKGRQSNMKRQISKYEENMNQEIAKRLSLLESEDNDPGSSFSKLDWFFVLLVVLIGVVITVYGAF